MLIKKKRYDHWGAVAHSKPYLDCALIGLPGERVIPSIRLSKNNCTGTATQKGRRAKEL